MSEPELTRSHVLGALKTKLYYGEITFEELNILTESGFVFPSKSLYHIRLLLRLYRNFNGVEKTTLMNFVSDSIKNNTMSSYKQHKLFRMVGRDIDAYKEIILHLAATNSHDSRIYNTMLPHLIGLPIFNMTVNHNDPIHIFDVRPVFFSQYLQFDMTIEKIIMALRRFIMYDKENIPVNTTWIFNKAVMMLPTTLFVDWVNDQQAYFLKTFLDSIGFHYADPHEEIFQKLRWLISGMSFRSIIDTLQNKPIGYYIRDWLPNKYWPYLHPISFYNTRFTSDGKQQVVNIWQLTCPQLKLKCHRYMCRSISERESSWPKLETFIIEHTNHACGCKETSKTSRILKEEVYGEY